METYKTIKKFLAEGGKCLLIENGEPIGVVLTVEEYEKLQNKRHGELIPGIEEFAEGEGKIPGIGREVEKEKPITNPIGEATAKEMDFPEASAEIADIASADDITLEDLGLDELPY